jgi:hypothetical protein
MTDQKDPQRYGQKEKKRNFTNIDRAYSRLKVLDGYSLQARAKK